jgi:hypothetical protein
MPKEKLIITFVYVKKHSIIINLQKVRGLFQNQNKRSKKLIANHLSSLFVGFAL